MRSTLFLGFLAAGLIAAAGVGCGDDGSGGQGGSGATGGAGGGTTTTGGAGGTGGMAGDGNDDFAGADELLLGNAGLNGDLDPVATDVDFYRFQGTAGQKILLYADAKPEGDEYNTAYPDLVVTLYSEDQTQIAQNDDPFPRFSNDPEIITELPADGTYYIRVAECNYVYPSGCAPSNTITYDNYQIVAFEIPPAALTAEGTEVAYSVSQNGGYGLELLNGRFSADTETDTFTFTVPADVTADAGRRPVSLFNFYPSGPQGHGSSTDVQLATIVDTTTSEIVAQVNPSLVGTDPYDRPDLTVPLMPGGSYRVELAHSTGAVGTNPFYFTYHVVDGRSYPLELAETDAMNNNTVASAQALVAEPADPGDTSGIVTYLVEGDLLDFGTTTDIADAFSFAVPAGMDRLSVFCNAQRSGSGLRDVYVSVRVGDDSEIPDGSITETAMTSAYLTGVALPAGESTLYLHVTGTQDASAAPVTSSFYRCQVSLFPPNAQ